MFSVNCQNCPNLWEYGESWIEYVIKRWGYTLKVDVADFRPDSPLPVKVSKDPIMWLVYILSCHNDVKCVEGFYHPRSVQKTIWAALICLNIYHQKFCCVGGNTGESRALTLWRGAAWEQFASWLGSGAVPKELTQDGSTANKKETWTPACHSPCSYTVELRLTSRDSEFSESRLWLLVGRMCWCCVLCWTSGCVPHSIRRKTLFDRLVG